MTAKAIVEIVTADLEKEPDTSPMNLSETAFAIGIYQVYRMHQRGIVSIEAGRRLKAKLTQEFERQKDIEDLFDKHIEAIKAASEPGVRLTKALKAGKSENEILSIALEVLNACGINGGVKWERRVS